jgi:hypothetical protein
MKNISTSSAFTQPLYKNIKNSQPKTNAASTYMETSASEALRMDLRKETSNKLPQNNTSHEIQNDTLAGDMAAHSTT